MVPSCYITGTTGAAQFECCAGMIIPRLSNLANSVSTLALRVKGTERALKTVVELEGPHVGIG